MRPLPTEWNENAATDDSALSSEHRSPRPSPSPYVPPPLDLLPSRLQQYIRVAAQSLNVDVSFVLLPLLSALGSAIGNARSILLKGGFIQPPVIWTGIIGRSVGRKSPALREGCYAVNEHEFELVKQNRTEKERYEEEFAEWESKQRKARGTKPELQPALTCLMDDLTIAALAEAIEVNLRGVLVKKDELSHWFASFDQFHAAKGADVSRWLSLHTAEWFGLDRRTDHWRARIWQPRVCITGGIQPQVLARVLTEDFFERGLAARFLFSYPPMRQDKWSEAEVPDDLRKRVSELFNKLWLLHRERHQDGARPRLLKLDADAKTEYVAFYNACGAAAMESDERTEAAFNKLTGYAARLALVGQLARDHSAKVITGEVMRAACALARWCGAEAARIYASLAEGREQRELRKLVEFVAARGAAATVRDVMQCYWPLKNKREETEKAFAQLVKEGRAEWEEIRPLGPGRPTRQIRLLCSSTSTKFDAFSRKAGNCVDVDAVEYRKNEPSDEPGITGRPAGPEV